MKRKRGYQRTPFDGFLAVTFTSFTRILPNFYPRFQHSSQNLSSFTVVEFLPAKKKRQNACETVSLNPCTSIAWILRLLSKYSHAKKLQTWCLHGKCTQHLVSQSFVYLFEKCIVQIGYFSALSGILFKFSPYSAFKNVRFASKVLWMSLVFFVFCVIHFFVALLDALRQGIGQCWRTSRYKKSKSDAVHDQQNRMQSNWLFNFL